MSRPVLVLGTVNRDRLLLPSSDRIAGIRDSLGGVCYSLSALAALHPELTPDCRVLAGDDVRTELLALLAGRGLSSGEVFFRPRPTNRIELDCRYPDHKRERSCLELGAYRPDECPTTPYAGVLVNFTSGREFGLGCWRHWRQQLLRTSPGVHLHMDLHSLSLDARRGRARRLRPLARWQSWVENLGLLQLTLAECSCLAPHAPRSLEMAHPLLGELHGLGIGRVVITDGERGFLYSDRGGIRRLEAIPAPVVDTTGCGDVLGAALFGGVLAGWPLERTLRTARRAATAKLGFSGLAGLAELAALMVAIPEPAWDHNRGPTPVGPAPSRS